MRWTDAVLRLRALLFWKRQERDLADEVEFHLAMQSRKNLAMGMSRAEARERARAVFGGLDAVKEDCRDQRGINLAVTLWQDGKYALRTFRRAPLYSLSVILTIGLALGLNTALFSIFNAYVLRPLAVQDPHALYRFTWLNQRGNEHHFTVPELSDFQRSNGAFAEGIGLEVFYARVEGHPTFGQAVTGNFFSMLGVSVQAGRILLPEDTRAGTAAPVMVLSDTAWRKKFGGDPSILGKRLSVRGQRLEVVGIAAPGFTGVKEQPMDFWVPLTLADRLSPEPDHFEIIGRLRPGASLEQTRARLAAWSAQATAGLPPKERAVGVRLEPRATAVPLSPEVIAAILPIAIAFGLVLLMACANIANMMLARGMARQREIGIRLSIGAGRGRLIRQLLTESLLLALPATAVGLALSRVAIIAGTRALYATLPAEFAEFLTIVPLEPDARVFLFLLGAALAAAILFGLAPALQSTRADVMRIARGDFENQHRPMRLRHALVLGQITVSVLLLICAGVLLRGADRLDRLDRGMNLRGVIDLEIEDRYRPAVLDRLPSFPFVRQIAAVGGSPLDGALPNLSVIPEHTSRVVPVWYRPASREYFALLGVPILRGRNFSRDEAESGEPVAIVSQATANLLWPGREAVGQSFAIVHDSHGHLPPGPLRHNRAIVIGVARDAISGWAGNGLDKTCIYFPTSPRAPGNALLIRVDGNAGEAIRKLDGSLSSLHPGAISQIHNMQQAIAMQIYPFRAAYWIAGAIGCVGLLLTLSGIYGVLAYVVTQRTREIGIRVALGATPAGVVRLILKQSLLRAAVGIGLGTLFALAVSTLFASMVPMVHKVDAVAYAGAILLVLGCCSAAAWLPARRVARIDPAGTLRHD